MTLMCLSCPVQMEKCNGSVFDIDANVAKLGGNFHGNIGNACALRM